MSTLLAQIYENSPLKADADPRTIHWPFVTTPWPVLASTSVYLLVLYFLPKLMQRRKPYKLNGLIIVYNIMMVLLNAHIVKELLLNAWRLDYDLWCEPCRVHRINAYEMRIAAASWWFFISKGIEFTDTIFFVLRKKTEQLSFLHIYHHSSMFPLQWLLMHFQPTGFTAFLCALNAFVHVVMYTYYALSAMGPRMRKHLWWKRYLTALQLVQFVIGATYSTQFVWRSCDSPRWMHVMNVIYMFTLLYLFSRFYASKYIKHRTAKDK